MWKTMIVRILETKTSETSFSIDVMIGYVKTNYWLVPTYKYDIINHNVEWILNKLKTIKDELHRVWIKNHNIESSFISVKLLLVINLVCVILIIVSIILFMSN
jgi:hypothetical protein